MKVYLVKYEYGDLYETYVDKVDKVFLDHDKAVDYMEKEKGAVYNDQCKTWDMPINPDDTYVHYSMIEMEVVE